MLFRQPEEYALFFDLLSQSIPKFKVKLAYYHGEFYGDPFYNEWKDLSEANPAFSVKDIPRHEAYIADWWQLLDETAVK